MFSLARTLFGATIGTAVRTGIILTSALVEGLPNAVNCVRSGWHMSRLRQGASVRQARAPHLISSPPSKEIPS